MMGFSAKKVNSNCTAFCYTRLVNMTRSEKGHSLCVFDLQKAFDAVPHRKLMCKLENYTYILYF